MLSSNTLFWNYLGHTEISIKNFLNDNSELGYCSLSVNLQMVIYFSEMSILRMKGRQQWI